MTSAYSLPSTRAHLDAMVATGADGWLALSTSMPEARGIPWASWCFTTDDVDGAAQAAAELDAQGRNVYVRTNLLNAPLPAPRGGWSSRRGGADDTGCVIALAVDLDVAGPGHKPGTGLPLPPDRCAAMQIVDGLPAPSLDIDTGGGLHLWWLLYEPVVDEPVQLLERWADRIVAAGAARGWHVDRPDPARVLRVCGTHRRKPDVPANRVTLRDVAGWPADGLSRRPWCPSGRYRPRDLLGALPEPAAPPPPPATSSRPRRAGEVGPADAVNRLSWAQILEPLGWTFAGMGSVNGGQVELWARPGATSPYSLKCFPDGPAVAWSDACGLPAGKGQRLNKWKVYVALHHPGTNEADVARLIRERSRELADV